MTYVDIPTAQASDICVIRTASENGVAPDLMLAIRSVERGVPGRSVLNTDETRDYNEPGLNTKTVDHLVREGWDAKQMLNDGCYAMSAASFWMRIKLLDARYTQDPLLSRAARYNSKTPVHNLAYQIKLKAPLKAWACHLHAFWNLPPSQLFALASNVITEKELSTCQPKKNPH